MTWHCNLQKVFSTEVATDSSAFKRESTQKHWGKSHWAQKNMWFSHRAEETDPDHHFPGASCHQMSSPARGSNSSSNISWGMWVHSCSSQLQLRSLASDSSHLSVLQRTLNQWWNWRRTSPTETGMSHLSCSRAELCMVQGKAAELWVSFPALWNDARLELQQCWGTQECSSWVWTGLAGGAVCSASLLPVLRKVEFGSPCLFFQTD